MNNDVGFEALLGRALALTRHDTGLPVAFGGLVGSRQQFTITHVSGGLTNSLGGLLIHSGQGIGGLALASRRIATVSDYLDSRRITHHYDSAVSSEQLRSIVAAPVIVNGQVRAVLYGADRAESSFGPRLLNALHECASRLAFNVAVAEETSKRVREMESAAIINSARQARSSVDHEAASSAHAELLLLASETDDEQLRLRLATIASRFSLNSAPGVQASASIALSTRETEVVAMVSLGYSNIEIGERLGLERETVKSYLRNCMRKLEVHSRTAAVSRARALGILP